MVVQFEAHAAQPRLDGPQYTDAFGDYFGTDAIAREHGDGNHCGGGQPADYSGTLRFNKDTHAVAHPSAGFDGEYRRTAIDDFRQANFDQVEAYITRR
jgi:hypothetical protein